MEKFSTLLELTIQMLFHRDSLSNAKIHKVFLKQNRRKNRMNGKVFDFARTDISNIISQRSSKQC
jgi:hypothetical protein